MLALAFSGGMLTKGPVALIAGACFIIASFWIEGRKARRSALLTLAAAAASVALFGVWLYPANLKTNGELWQQRVIHHQIDRITSPLEHHGGHSLFDFGFYFIDIAAAFFPWTLLLPAALAALIGTPREASAEQDPEADHFPKTPSPSDARRFLWIWIGLYLAVMIAVTTKLPHYILPIWPAFAIWHRRAFRLRAVRAVNPDRMRLAPRCISPASAARQRARSTSFHCWLQRMRTGVSSFRATKTLSLFSGRSRRWWAVRWRSSIRGCTTGNSPRFCLPNRPTCHCACRGILRCRRLRRWKPLYGRGAHRQSANLASNTVPVAVSGYNEPSLIFYLRRPEVLDIANEKVLAEWSQQPGQAVLVIPKRLLEKFKAKDAAAGVERVR